MTTALDGAIIVLMSTETNREGLVREPAGTILAELGRRRGSVGRLAAATDLSSKTLQRRLDDPDQFRLGEIRQIATALEVPPSDLVAPWAQEVQP